MERVQVRAVRLDEILDLVLERVDVAWIIVHGDDLMADAAELAGEVGAETSKADDAEFHEVGGFR
jgi:hypothetical protein